MTADTGYRCERVHRAVRVGGPRRVSEEYEVHGLSRRPPADQPGIFWHQADLLSPSADKVIRDIGATHLLHLAWATERRSYWTSDENLLWLDASTRLLRNFRVGGGNSFVGVGTCSEYAPPRSDAPSSRRLLPPGASTARARPPWLRSPRHCLGRGLLPPGPVVLPLRAGGTRGRLVPRLLGAAASGGEINVHADHVRDYLHVSDAAKALRCFYIRRSGAQ